MVRFLDRDLMISSRLVLTGQATVIHLGGPGPIELIAKMANGYAAVIGNPKAAVLS